MQLTIHFALFAMFVLLSRAAAVPNYFAFYDLSLPNASAGAADLLAFGPTMRGGAEISNGIFLAPGATWVDAGIGTPFILRLDSGRSRATVITAFAPDGCVPGQFLTAVVSARNYTVGGPRRCGIVCIRSDPSAATWSLACEDGLGTERGDNFTTVAGSATTVALKYFKAGKKIAMEAFVHQQPHHHSAATNLTRSFCSSRISFFYGSSLTFVPPPGRLYYLGFMDDVITEGQFSRLTSENPDSKPATCSNCVEGFKCAAGRKIIVAPLAIREYFCPCDGPERGYVLSLRKCGTVVSENCSLSCPQGCRDDSRSQCKSQCPATMLAQTSDGEFVTCGCDSATSSYDPTTQSCLAHFSAGETSATDWQILVGMAIPALAGFLAFSFLARCRAICRRLSHAGSAANASTPAPLQLQGQGGLQLESVRFSAECKVCYRTGVRMVALIPCGHAWVCEECAKRICVCPFDRTDIAGTVVVDREMQEKIGQTQAGTESSERDLHNKDLERGPVIPTEK